ncbi:hypothetical protein BDP55DRAFT_734891 [Colletotrichum godetiae]|uniref:Mid2 domain-containing protein n=1 Tax=Colletotrichum godetiae TaxID=1209918 RepID=A0AAJ0END4_9PEZI|nr:uncharacterized protein BDP55DRAFT_734891 [Colletotrichum godetiae]KAK1657467.1 hypothetical protein BDP55DRAFT_734891 [Colletotrichum godetiae]
MKNPDCACRLGTQDSMRTQWAIYVWPLFAAYCVTNGWLNASQTDLTSIVTLTTTQPIIVTRTRSATSEGDGTRTTVGIETSISETEAGSTPAQAATPTTQSTAPIAEPTSAIGGENSDSSSSSSELSTGVKAGIGAGAALAAMLAVILLFWWRKRKKVSLSDSNENNITSELGGGDKSDRYELDSYTTPLEADKKSPASFTSQQN